MHLMWKIIQLFSETQSLPGHHFQYLRMVEINSILKSKLTIFTMKLVIFFLKTAFFKKIGHFDPISMPKISQDKKIFEEPKITTGITRSNISSTLTALSPAEIS